MSRILKTITYVLIVAICVQAIAWAYIFGVEHGVNSQMPIIKELTDELHPDLIIDYSIYFHPLRNTLTATSFILICSWILIIIITFDRKRKTNHLF